MNEMFAARFNIWWFLSFIAPALIMIIGAFWHKKWVLIIAILLSLVTTYMLCNLAVRKMWDTRCKIAKTEEEIAYATADGANLVFTAFVIGPFESVLYTTIWGVLGWRLWPRIKGRGKLFV
jgi:hypothetical protein